MDLVLVVGGMADLDPELVALVVADPDPVLAALQTADPLAAVIAAEPPPKARVDHDQLDGLAEAFADLADLKCRFTLGHSRGVAALVDGAAHWPASVGMRAVGCDGRRSCTMSGARACRPGSGSARDR